MAEGDDKILRHDLSLPQFGYALINATALASGAVRRE
jgi:hypothetical protein